MTEVGTVESRLRALLAGVLPLRERAHSLAPAALLRDAGLGSFQLMQLITGIEDTFGVSLGDADLEDRHFVSLESVERLVAAKLGG